MSSIQPAPAPAPVTGDLRKTVLLLAWPVLCEQFLNSCVAFYDTYLAGGISANATTAVGFAAYVGWLAGMLFGLINAGTTALVARHWGAGQPGEANRVANRSLALAACLGGIVYGFVYVAAPWFAYMLDLQDEVRQTVIGYLRIDGLGHIVTAVTLAGAAALRGVGDMRSPMWILGWVSVLNVILSRLLVFGVGPFPLFGAGPLITAMGIDGIVWGTVISRIVGGLMMLSCLSKGRSGLQIEPRELRIRGELVQRILRIGIPAAIDGCVTWAGQFVFLMIIGALETVPGGSTNLAAHMIGVRVEAITYLPAVAWGSAAATIVGQSLGAGDPRRAVQAGHTATWQCSLLAAVITLVFYFGAPGIYGLMHEDRLVQEVGTPALRMLAFFQVPLVCTIVYQFALRGAGDTRFPMICNVLGAVGIRVPVAYVCGIMLDGGLIGAWIGMCADISIRGCLLWLRYVREKWLLTSI